MERAGMEKAVCSFGPLVFWAEVPEAVARAYGGIVEEEAGA